MTSDWITSGREGRFADRPEPPVGMRYAETQELVKVISQHKFTFGVDTPVWSASGHVVNPATGEATDDAEATAQFVFIRAAGTDAVRRPPPPRKQRLTVLGYLEEETFQMCREAAAYLNAEYSSEYSVSIEDMMGFEFERKRDELAAAGGSDEDRSRIEQMRVIVYDADERSIKSGAEWIADIEAATCFRRFELPHDDPQSYASLARLALRQHLSSTGSTFVWMLVKIDDIVLGRIVFQLFSNICPKTALNFQHLCRGDLADVPAGGGEPPIKLSYKGSTFYRIVRNGWIQGGDIVGAKVGNGGHSIYGRTFPDESFDVPHDDAGTLGMVNDGEHTNSSSFYVTMKKSRWMNGRYVAFGRVVEGLQVVRAIHDTDIKHNQTPVRRITIDDCGDVPLDGQRVL